ncbi:MAG TPA: hypothetical protein DGR79_06040, partial [Clostridiales bacterium]|nr:hypothetical protein [Clostridiales bacterium]
TEAGGGPGPVITPRGYRYLQGFDLTPLPLFTYYVGGFFVERTMFMVRGENRIVVLYRFQGPRRARLSLRLRPLVTLRFYHHLMRANDWPFTTAFGGAEGGWVTVEPYPGSPVLVLRHDGGAWSPGGTWHLDIDYLEERRRGLDHVEDLYTPGFLEFTDIGSGDTVAVSAVLAEDREDVERLKEAGFDVGWALERQAEEERRLFALVERARTAVEGAALALGRRVDLGATVRLPPEKRDVRAPEIGDPSTPEASAFFARLVRATDAFVAVRGGGTPTGPGRRTTVIAGYPWFEDWGRDTFVALPGLFLVTGRHEEALRVLEDYASFIRDGLVPNRFPDQADEPDYNTVDASLWFFTAVGAYLAYTGDVETVLDRLLEPMRDIALHYLRGTRFGIRAAADGLLRAGEPGVAVTWMDAKLGDWVVTPRHGYPVEINALWYNALRLLAELDRDEAGAGLPGDVGGASAADGDGGGPNWRQLASRVRASFNARFWNPDKGCLYDVVHDLDSGLPPDAAVRPNQLIAVSLPFPVLDPTRWRSVVEVCFRELFVPFGLRTLSRGHPAYRGLYRGGPAERDGAYHQGTVWPWLLGPFVTALRRALGYTEESRLLAARILRPFERHLREAGIGYISEVFDGDFPHLPGGCIAQAWSVAEILRAYVEEVLDVRPGLAGRGSLPGGRDPADGKDEST